MWQEVMQVGLGAWSRTLFSDSGGLGMRLPSPSLYPSGLRIRRVWQKRKCGVKYGCLTISHSTVRPGVRPRPVHSSVS